MQQPVRIERYPAEIRRFINVAPPLMIEIANRWVLGWPEAVTTLIESGGYLEALENQEQQEREILASTGTSLLHLARHEILQEYGLSLSPPEAKL